MDQNLSDICIDIIEPARRTQPARAQDGRNHVFVGFTHGVDLMDNSASGGDTLLYSEASHRSGIPSRCARCTTVDLGAALMMSQH